MTDWLNSPRSERPQQTTSRREFVGAASALATLGWFDLAPLEATPAPTVAGIPDGFPRSDPAVVEALVRVAHTDVSEVRRLVEHQPSLARASWDWGYGDWETGLGAAAHTGQREIAELLLAHGARPTVFSATMMGHLGVVKAFVAALPGIQRTLGPHSLTLMSHARAGGKEALPVLQFLESLGDADVRPPSRPLAAAIRDALVGRFGFGSGDRDYFDVDVRQDQLGLQRPQTNRRFLIHTGDNVFFPSGVPSVRIAFVLEGGRASQFTIADPEVFVTARRIT